MNKTIKNWPEIMVAYPRYLEGDYFCRIDQDNPPGYKDNDTYIDWHEPHEITIEKVVKMEYVRADIVKELEMQAFKRGLEALKDYRR